MSLLMETGREAAVPGDEATGGITYFALADAVVVSLWGEIDAALRDVAGQAMAFVIDTPGRLVIDVADLAFVDSTGVAFILQLHLVAVEDGREVVLRNPRPALRDLLEMIGAGSRIPVERTRAGRTAIERTPVERTAVAAEAGPRR